MKFIKKALLLCCVLAIAFTAFGCSESGLDDTAASLSNYTINAVFDDEQKTLTASQSVDYINEYDVISQRVQRRRAFHALYRARQSRRISRRRKLRRHKRFVA